MKKVFALSMAAAMVMSLSAVSMAASNSDLKDEDGDVIGVLGVNQDTMLKWDSNLRDMIYWTEDGTENGVEVDPTFGKVLYYRLYDAEQNAITDSKAVSNLNINAKWSDGASYVKGVEIVKKGGSYYIAVTTQGSSLEPVDVSGKIYLKGTSGTGEGKQRIDGHFDVDFTLAYGEVIVGASDNSVIVSATDMVYDLSDNEEKEFTFQYGANGSEIVEIVTDVASTDRLLLGYNTDEVEELVQIYNKANLDFINMKGAFKKTSDVTLYAEEGTYLYKYENGKLSAVDAEYDDWDEAFSFRTKALGTYVISDVKLNTSA
ncbi:MAG: hypothetical protein IKL92_00770, partial [Oscillospiraceae bacterium]|nr:hypothetical protein [Oscillospiraceae bacterium]